MPSNGYSGAEVLSMQQDAIRRVQEMQRRANAHLTPSAAPPEEPPAQPPADPPKKPEEAPPTKTIGGLLEQFGVDPEQALLLVLLLLLAQEKADSKLLLALAYLLL